MDEIQEITQVELQEVDEQADEEKWKEQWKELNEEGRLLREEYEKVEPVSTIDRNDGVIWVDAPGPIPDNCIVINQFESGWWVAPLDSPPELLQEESTAAEEELRQPTAEELEEDRLFFEKIEREQKEQAAAEAHRLEEARIERQARMDAEMEQRHLEYQQQQVLQNTAVSILQGGNRHVLLLLNALFEDSYEARYAFRRIDLKAEHIADKNLRIIYTTAILFDDLGHVPTLEGVIYHIYTEHEVCFEGHVDQLVQIYGMAIDMSARQYTTPPSKAYLFAQRIMDCAKTRDSAPIEAAAREGVLASVQEVDSKTVELVQIMDKLGLDNNIAVRPAADALAQAGHGTQRAAVAAAVRVRKTRL